MGPRAADAGTAPNLTGTWRLVSYEARDGRGEVRHPFGESASGQLVYDHRGHMSAHVMRGDRPRFAVDDQAGGTDGEVRAAFEGHVSYFGTYTIDSRARTVTHHVEGASYPNWVGRDQVRHYELHGARLTLSTPPIVLDGQPLTFVLTWERVA